MDTKAMMDLQLFADEGGGAAGAAGEAATGTGPQTETPGAKGKNPLAKVQYGKQEAPLAQGAEDPVEDPAEGEGEQGAGPQTLVTSDTAEERRAAFDKLIRGEYKDLYDERAQQMIDARFKKTKELEARTAALSPVLDLLGQKYGVNAADAEALSKAIQEDNSFYEDAALKAGMEVEQYKAIKKLERENAEFKRAADEAKRRQQAGEVYAKWQREGEAVKGIYPGFDMRHESTNPESGPRFMALLQNGVDVRTAYEVIHKDEIIGGAMQYTAQAVQKKVVNDIRARGMRPDENGGGGTAPAAVVKADPSKLSKKDREEISQRVLRGERIVW